MALECGSRGAKAKAAAHGHRSALLGALDGLYGHANKAKSPQTNGVCEPFHKTMLEEFNGVVFRRKIYQDSESLQQALGEWLHVIYLHPMQRGRICPLRVPLLSRTERKSSLKKLT
jgi:hypothetical protein